MTFNHMKIEVRSLHGKQFMYMKRCIIEKRLFKVRIFSEHKKLCMFFF